MRHTTEVPNYLRFCFPQFWSENIKFVPKILNKNLRINNSYILNCMPFWIVWWNLMLSCSILPRMWIIFLSSISMLYMLPTFSSHWLSDQRERERGHIHIAFITVYCYNCSILVLVFSVNLLLCLIYKTYHSYVYIRKTLVYIGFKTIWGSRHPLRVLEHIPCG